MDGTVRDASSSSVCRQTARVPMEKSASGLEAVVAVLCINVARFLSHMRCEYATDVSATACSESIPFLCYGLGKTRSFRVTIAFKITVTTSLSTLGPMGMQNYC